MNIFQPTHNANLLNTVPDSCPVVNDCVVKSTPVIDYIHRYDDGESAWYKVDYAPSKLFVKVTNSIYDYQLHPRLLEFYCLMSYLCYSLPTEELPILKIRELINQFTGININKNSINTYLNDLISLGLIKRVGKFYHIHEPKLETSLEVSTKNPKKNFYFNPTVKWTPFYITIYNTDTKFGSMAVEMYLASKAYNYHHPEEVCKDLNISRKTYYTYLKDLISKRIVRRHRLSYKCYHYTHDYRLVLWNDYESIMESRYELNDMNWKEMKAKRLQTRLDRGKTTTAHSRHWYQSAMGRVMKDYGINYHPRFNNYNPEDAYLIVQELEQQYRCSGGKLNASIIVRGILEAWNWTKIQDRIHAKRKRSELIENSRRYDSKYMMDYAGIV
jgi:predicted transcriptional regulator